jgi:transposase
MKLSVGVDLHKTQFTVCLLSEDRKVIKHGRFLTNKKGYEDFLKNLEEFEAEDYDVALAVESTGNTRYFKNQVTKKGFDVTVVNTAKFKVVTESVKKTDKHDAYTLAEFLEKDMLPESQLCSEESEQIRRVIKARSILVKALVSVKNQIHGFLLSYGIESKRGQLQSKKERQRILCGLEDHRSFGDAAKTVKPLLETIDRIYEEVKKLEKVLEELVKEDEDVKLLISIPGVGLITAATIRAFTDDINRYDSGKKYAAHAGLVPWVQNSNMTVHHGHITKRGPMELRTAFVQVVMGMIRSSKKTENFRIMNKYQDMKKHKGSGKSIIATARKVSTIVWTILKKREPFDPLKMYEIKIWKDIPAAVLDAATAG